MGKAVVSINDIFGSAPDINLNKYISIPSAVHGYSLAIEYIRDWILESFPKDFFKTVHVGGKHIFADYRKFNKEKIQQVQKPALGIYPAMNTDYNRENVDLIQGGLDIYTRRSPYFDDRFFADKNSNLYIAVQFKQIEMPFQIRMRVKSKAQQLDLLDYVRVNCRIGSTQTHFIDMDCHVPYDIIISLAMDMGFELVQDVNEGYHIKDIVGFLNYLNSNSKLPFLYKLRTINGRCEFFIRIKHCHTRISCLEGVSVDDGERQGSLDSNFHVEFAATLLFSVPAIYSYQSMQEHTIMNKEVGDIKALYQIISVKPPEVNTKGWGQYLTTQWIDDTLELKEIKFEELLGNEDLQRVIKHNVDIGLSPSIFMEIKIYNGQREIPIYIDWENYTIKINRKVIHDVSDIAIYADLGYINNTLDNIDNLSKDRIRESEKQ